MFQDFWYGFDNNFFRIENAVDNDAETVRADLRDNNIFMVKTVFTFVLAQFEQGGKFY